jgi:hypothetical protein
MKKIVVIGAFDRYNYGDNLMPILFEFFLKKFYPNVFSNYEIVYSALVDSDLTKYKAKKTIAMHKVLGKKNEHPHSIISIGGEVLGASSSTLFLHMNNSKAANIFIAFLKKYRMTFFADILCKNIYKLPWEYPYLPPKLSGTLTVFNTIGGDVSKYSLSQRLNKIRIRISNSDYLSVRDSRVVKSIDGFSSPNLLPDSAIVMGDLITDDFLINECSDKIFKLKNKSYICFQAAPKKSGATAVEWAKTLSEISEKYNLEVILCPIGYANGHDDIDFLKEIHKNMLGKSTLVYELTLWEIMFVIKNSTIFLGTSLHGVITALSFSVPYIGLNPNVVKLDAFLKDWGISPSNRCYSANEILNVIESILQIDEHDYNLHSVQLKKLGMENNHLLVNALGISKENQ